MVVLNRIYTRTGDDGTTALGTGERRKKHDLRIAAYGTVDELNSVIGIARLHTADSATIEAMIKERMMPSLRRGADQNEKLTQGFVDDPVVSMGATLDPVML